MRLVFRRMKVLPTIIFICLCAFFGCTESSSPDDSLVITRTEYKDIRNHFSIEAGSNYPDSLADPFPNPYNHSNGDKSINIRFTLADSGNVKLIIQNAIGDSVVVFQDTTLKSGSYSAEWVPFSVERIPLRAGLYFITLRAAPNARNYIESHLLYIENND